MNETEEIAMLLFEYIIGTRYGEVVTHYNDDLILGRLESVSDWMMPGMDAHGIRQCIELANGLERKGDD